MSSASPLAVSAALAASIIGQPVLLLAVPAAIIVCGAAKGIAEALHIGLRARMLRWMHVDDPNVGAARRPRT